MKGLVTYGDAGEPFLLDAAGQGEKLGEPTKRINGVQYVNAMKRLVTCDYAGKLFPFDAAGPGKKLNGPSRRRVPTRKGLLSKWTLKANSGNSHWACCSAK